MPKYHPVCLLIALLCAAHPSFAQVVLPAVLNDHMVLQRDQPIPVWGTASPGESITITLQTKSETTKAITENAVADANGKWSIKLAPQPASDQPHTLIVAASNSITLTNILIGDVWLCSGQSNMHWPLKQSDSAAEVALATLPKMRLLNLKANAYPSGHEFTQHELESCQPDRYLAGKWCECTPESVEDFSAIGFLFGRELLEKNEVPIGLIHNAVGGTPTEAWVSVKSLRSDERLHPLFDSWPTNELVHSFCRDRAALNLRGVTAKKELIPRHPYHPGFMFEAGIAPIAPFGLRGAIWYQGESNAHNPALHDILFPRMISEWRRAWSQGDFPFLYVQLPNMETTQWQAFRASQAKAQSLPNVGMAVAIDVGSPSDVHPRNKHEVAHRLALLARSIVYSEVIESSGPVLKSVERRDQELRLSFAHATGLAMSAGEKLAGFEVAGADGIFVSAEARIEQEQIVVDHPEATSLKMIRYAFSPNPHCNLVNAAGLPAAPFEAAVK